MSVNEHKNSQAEIFRTQKEINLLRMGKYQKVGGGTFDVPVKTLVGMPISHIGVPGFQS